MRRTCTSLRPPSLDHGFYGLLGTDVLGRSVLARLVDAAGGRCPSRCPRCCARC
ncbi:hypothetical protein SANTM175S_03735 [Streptomyces antimycoticus]